MGQKPIEGSNPSLSAIGHVNSRRFRSPSRGSHEAEIRTRDMEKGVRQNRRRRFWTTRTRRPKGEGRRPESIPPSAPNGTLILVGLDQLPSQRRGRDNVRSAAHLSSREYVRFQRWTNALPVIAVTKR